jgi:hypothetical protein
MMHRGLRSPRAHRDLVAGQIIADDDVTDAQRGTEHLLDVGQERRAIDRPVEHQWRHEAFLTQAAQKGRGVPVPTRHGGHQALTTGSAAAMCSSHVGGSPGLIQKNQPRTVELGL